MCGGGGSTKKADPVQAYQANPQNVADTSNDTFARARVVAGTTDAQTFGSELGTGTSGAATTAVGG